MKCRCSLVLAACLALASVPAVAQTLVDLQPRAPYADQPFEVVVLGFDAFYQPPADVSIDGDLVTVRLDLGAEGLVDPPAPWAATVDLPGLAAGTYTLRVLAGSGATPVDERELVIVEGPRIETRTTPDDLNPLQLEIFPPPGECLNVDVDGFQPTGSPNTFAVSAEFVDCYFGGQRSVFTEIPGQSGGDLRLVLLRDLSAPAVGSNILFEETIYVGDGDPRLLGERFQVNLEWEAAPGSTGRAFTAAPPSDRSALFYFFRPENWEVMVSVLDGCAINGHYWVYAAGTTDRGWTLTVSDTEGDAFASYTNDLGEPSEAITDVMALPCE